MCKITHYEVKELGFGPAWPGARALRCYVNLSENKCWKYIGERTQTRDRCQEILAMG